MLFEITNPSDPYTMEAPDLKTAAAAGLILGAGQYGLHELKPSGVATWPILAFSSDEEIDRYVRVTLLPDTASPVQNLMAWAFASSDVAAALESVWIGDEADRMIREKLNAAERMEFYDKKRSSLNDIGRKAWEYATSIRN